VLGAGDDKIGQSLLMEVKQSDQDQQRTARSCRFKGENHPEIMDSLGEYLAFSSDFPPQSYI
jgi:hypothetical protein